MQPCLVEWMLLVESRWTRQDGRKHNNLQKKKTRKKKRTYIESFRSREALSASLPHAGELLGGRGVVLHAVPILIVPDRGNSSRRRRRRLSSSGRGNLSRLLLRGLALALILLIILQYGGLGGRRLALRGRGRRRRRRVERRLRHGCQEKSNFLVLRRKTQEPLGSPAG